MVSIATRETLVALGMRIRGERLRRNETQARFAARLAISVPTLRKLEGGDPAVSLGLLAEALFILEKLDELDGLLASPAIDPFALWEKETKPQSQRRRASVPRRKA